MAPPDDAAATPPPPKQEERTSCWLELDALYSCATPKHQFEVVYRDGTFDDWEHIEITAERACRVCNVRIGTKVFGLYPNGILVCYRCMMRNGKDAHHVCPVTKRDFSKEHGKL